MRGAQSDALLDLIYDAPYQPERWVGVMERLIDEAGCYVASLTQLDIVTGSGSGLAAHTAPETMHTYLSHWAARNPLVLVEDPAAYRRGWIPKILRSEAWLEENRLRKTDYFNEFLSPIGADQSIIVRLGLHGNVVTTINIARPDRWGRIEDWEIDAIARYQPHLVRATNAAFRLQLSQNALDQLDATLQHCGQALFFIDTRSRIRQFSAVAENLLSAGQSLRLEDGMLRAMTPEADRLLQAIIADPMGGTMSLPDSAGTVTHVLSVSPMGPRSVAMFSVEPLRLVSITASSPTALPTLEERFGLTPAEARIVKGLLGGLALKDLAGRQAVSLSTVRVQLAASFSKIGVHRQSDLVRLLLSQGYRGDGQHADGADNIGS